MLRQSVRRRAAHPIAATKRDVPRSRLASRGAPGAEPSEAARRTSRFVCLVPNDAAQVDARRHVLVTLVDLVEGVLLRDQLVELVEAVLVERQDVLDVVHR